MSQDTKSLEIGQMPWPATDHTNRLGLQWDLTRRLFIKRKSPMEQPKVRPLWWVKAKAGIIYQRYPANLALYVHPPNDDK